MAFSKAMQANLEDVVERLPATRVARGASSRQRQEPLDHRAQVDGIVRIQEALEQHAVDVRPGRIRRANAPR